jgi:hypothetical protein
MRYESQAHRPWINTSRSTRVQIACGLISAPASRGPVRHMLTAPQRASLVGSRGAMQSRD